MGKASRFVIDESSTIRFYNWVCIPIVAGLKKKILN